MEAFAFLNPYLRVIHIIAGLLWVGVGFAATVLILPAQLHAGRSGVSFTRALYGQTPYGRIFAIVGGVTILAGLLLYATGSWQHFSQTGNMVLGFGAVAGILAGGHGSAVGKYSEQFHQAALKVDTDQPKNEDIIEMEQIGAKLKRHSWISLVIVFVAVFAMASARYL